MQYGPSGSGGFDSPPVHCRSAGLSVEFEHVSSEFGARAEFPEANFPQNLPQFWDFHPKPNFLKNLPQFWDFHPEPNFPTNLPEFWDFHPEPNFPKNCHSFGFFPNTNFGNFRFAFPLF